MSETDRAEAGDAAPGMTVDIVSDVVCPWCYIGKRRLEAAFAARGGPLPSVRWHPFQLNPDIPTDGVDRRSYLEGKFGGPERARDVYARVEAAGREMGIPFRFEQIGRQPNTTDAHRLIAWAQTVVATGADRLVERLFRAYFTEGVDIGAVDELARLAGESGWDREAARAHLATAAGRAEVADADARMKSMGIGGSPVLHLQPPTGGVRRPVSGGARGRPGSGGSVDLRDSRPRQVPEKRPFCGLTGRERDKRMRECLLAPGNQPRRRFVAPVRHGSSSTATRRARSRWPSRLWPGRLPVSTSRPRAGRA